MTATKQVHNIRVRLNDPNGELVKQVIETFLTGAAIERKDAQITFQSDGETFPLFSGELWVDRQQPVRKLLKFLRENLTAADKASITSKPSQFVDISTHCFLRLDKAKFLAGVYELTTGSHTIHLRLNIAAFPATKENAEKIVAELFA